MLSDAHYTLQSLMMSVRNGAVSCRTYVPLELLWLYCSLTVVTWVTEMQSGHCAIGARNCEISAQSYTMLHGCVGGNNCLQFGKLWKEVQLLYISSLLPSVPVSRIDWRGLMGTREYVISEINDIVDARCYVVTTSTPILKSIILFVHSRANHWQLIVISCY